MPIWFFSRRLAACLSFTLPVYAAPFDSDRELIHHQENQRAREAQLAPPAPDVRLSKSIAFSDRLHFPKETPCFPVHFVELQNREAFPHWLPLGKLANQARGQCLGAKGINLLMSGIQNRLVDYGHVTSRVLAPQQNMHTGKLMLTLIPGVVHRILMTPQSGRYITPGGAFPIRQGALLNLRDIEQGLENLQRVPTVNASMEIVPGLVPGESDIVVDWQQARHWRLGLSFDDSGSRSTGRYQGGVTLYVDNPLSLSDMLYLSAGMALQPHHEKNSRNYTGQYSVPLGYWAASVTASSNDYYQTVAGADSDYRYSGDSRNLAFQLSRVLHRNGSQKTTLTYDVMARESRNYINDTEIEVQRRRTSAWSLGLLHRHYIGNATLDAGASYQRGTRWFGAMPAPEEYFGEATALSKIVKFNAQLALPFSVGTQNLSYSVQYQRQISHTSLTPQDQFSIGNRWTVRGFDGERTLNADNGWLVRNELAWQTSLANQQLYLGVDYGEVSGHGTEFLTGTHLAGGALGLRGSLAGLSYDAYAGMPLSKPAGLSADPVTFGFNLNWSY